MIDDDDKVRRNLMVVSFAVCVYFWLQLPDDLVVKRLLGADAPSQIDAWKVWALLLLVVVYQIHRYGSITSGQAGWIEAKVAWNSQMLYALHRLSKLNVERAKRGQWLVLARSTEPRIKALTDATFQPVSDDPALTWRYPDYATTLLLEIRYYGHGGTNPTHALWVGPSRVTRWAFSLFGFAKLVLTRHFSEFGVPIVLGATALGLCIFKLISLVM